MINWQWAMQKKEMLDFRYILYTVYKEYVYFTLRHREYPRASSEGLIFDNSLNWQREDEIANEIYAYVSDLSIEEGIVYVGALTGAWMLSCPEVMIPEIEIKGNWRNENLYGKTSDDEKRLLFKLDTLMMIDLERFITNNVTRSG